MMLQKIPYSSVTCRPPIPSDSVSLEAIGWPNRLQKCKDRCFLSSLPCPQLTLLSFLFSFQPADAVRHSFHPDDSVGPLLRTLLNSYSMKLTTKSCFEFELMELQMKESPLSVSMFFLSSHSTYRSLTHQICSDYHLYDLPSQVRMSSPQGQGSLFFSLMCCKT